MASEHCVVIGAGTVGSSCAWHLQRRGFQVTLVDPELPGQSCSFGNAACVSPSAVVPFSYPGMTWKLPRWLLDPLGPVRIRPRDFPALVPWFWRFWRAGNMQKVREITAAQALLMNAVFDDFDEVLQATASSNLKIARGTIHLWDTEKEFQADRWQLELCRQHGFTMRRLAPAELKEMAPNLVTGEGVGVLMPEWHHLLDPALVTERIAEDCFANGGAWLQDRVQRIATRGRGVHLTTASGLDIAADKLVVAAGVWSNQLAGQLDYPVPMVPKRGYHAHIAQPGVTLDYPVLSISHHFVMTPMLEGIRLAGTAEFAALDAPPDYRRAQALVKLAGRYLDGLQAPEVSEWMGQRPMTSDSLPVISASPASSDVFYAFGHGHFGLTQGPTTGRIIADMVAGAKPDIDLAPFGIARFAKSRKVNESQ
jgi:D-amino-acid dehydrogenase